MYVTGIITEIQGYKAKIRIPEYDDFETNFLDIPQLFTVSNKSQYLPEIGALVSAVLNDDMTDGAILGQIYNDIDAPDKTMAGAEHITFSDGVSVYHYPNSGQIFIHADTCCFDVKEFVVTGDIKGQKDISDSKGTMQKMRDTYNSHKHPNGNEGAPTGAPDAQMA